MSDPYTTIKVSEYEKFREVIDCLADMVSQHCYTEDEGVYHSGFISANAFAMRLLCEMGVMEMVHDGVGRGVEAKFKNANRRV